MTPTRVMLLVVAMIALMVMPGVRSLGRPPARAATPLANPSPSDPPPGPVRVFTPPVAPRGVVALFSEERGWTEDLDVAAAAIAEAGQVVMGFDTGRLLAPPSGGKAQSGCLSLARPIAAAIATALAERRQAVDAKSATAPVLAGAREGASLAYAVLAQAPAGLFSGAIGVGFNGEAASAAPLCPGAEPERVSAGLYRYAPMGEMPGWVRLVSANPEDPLLVSYAIDGGARIVAVRGDGDLAAAVIAALADVHHGARGPTAATDIDLDDLPLVPMPVEHSGETMAIIYSGDGGWRDADKSIGEALRADGVPVVGVDALRYFWHEKTPGEVEADLDAILDYYPAAWNRPRVLLIGYSFGADVLPFVVARLRPENRARIAQVSLLGFAARADFKIQVTSWLGNGPSEDGRAVLPEVAKLDLSRVQCFYGEEEQDTACTDPALRGAEIVALPGGHHFDGDYGAIARRILDGARRRASTH